MVTSRIFDASEENHMSQTVLRFGAEPDLVQANVNHINAQLARPSNRGSRRVVLKLDHELWDTLEPYQKTQVIEMVSTSWRDVRVCGGNGHGAVSLHLGDPVRKLAYPTL